jgi:putative aldouronate transport system permease protein
MYGIQLAFKEFRFDLGIWGSPWNGLFNFERMFANPLFTRAFWNTLIISFGRLVTGFPVPIILVLLLNELRNMKFKRITQTILYLPHFISWVVIAGLLFNIFNVTAGLYGNLYREIFNATPPSILTNADWFRGQLYISAIWKGAGWGMIIYLAAIAGIDPGLYESAQLDGANRFQMAMYITIPMLTFAIALNLILSIGSIMDAGFDQIINLYTEPTFRTGDIIDTFVFRFGITQGRFEVGAAVGLFKSVINCALLITANKLSGKLSGYSLF